LVKLGNAQGMAMAVALTYELGSLVSFITLFGNILRRIKKEFIYIIFIILFLLQAFGNVYSSFSYMRVHLLSDSQWLASFMEMTMNSMDLQTAKLMLSIMIGLPIPLISLILLKSSIDYFFSHEKTVDESEKETIVSIDGQPSELNEISITIPEQVAPINDNINNTEDTNDSVVDSGANAETPVFEEQIEELKSTDEDKAQSEGLNKKNKPKIGVIKNEKPKKSRGNTRMPFEVIDDLDNKKYPEEKRY
jgi:hypothetical protein